MSLQRNGCGKRGWAGQFSGRANNTYESNNQHPTNACPVNVNHNHSLAVQISICRTTSNRDEDVSCGDGGMR